MDVQTIDQQYGQLQRQAEGTVGELRTLASKLQTASQNGNPDAREWLLDLKSIALAVQAEQNQVGLLLQALHGFVASQEQAMTQAPPQSSAGGWMQAGAGPSTGYGQAGYGQPAGYGQGGYAQGGPNQGYAAPQQQGGVGGMFGNFLNSGFGRAIETGAGFGIGDELIQKLF